MQNFQKENYIESFMIDTLKNKVPLARSIPSSIKNPGIPKDILNNDYKNESENTMDLSEGKCDLSDIHIESNISSSLKLETGNEIFKLYQNRLLSYDEAKKIFYRLYEEHYSNMYFIYWIIVFIR